MKTTRMALAAAVLAAAGAPAGATIGLAARFGDVILENADVGRTYNLRESVKVPFGIENRGDEETEIVVEFLPPRKQDLSAGYEPIPDPSWFKALPAKMVIGPRSIGFFDLLMTVPDDPKLKGRHFQAVVKGRMTGGFLALAVENKIRFSIGPGPAALEAEKKKKAMQKLDFDVNPQSVYVTAVPLGVEFDVKKEQGKALRVANYDAAPLALSFSAAAWDSREQPPEGYEPIPDPSWLTFRSAKVKVAGGAIGQVQLVLKIPNNDKHRGKKYAVLVKTGLEAGFWLDAPVKVFVETQP
jgi:hypothetical protein